MMLGEGSSASLTEDQKITGYLHLGEGGQLPENRLTLEVRCVRGRNRVQILSLSKGEEMPNALTAVHKTKG